MIFLYKCVEIYIYRQYNRNNLLGLIILKDNPVQMDMLFRSLPSLIADINAMSPTFMKLKNIQSNVNLNGLNGQTASRNVFRILNSVQPFKPDIDVASQVYLTKIYFIYITIFFCRLLYFQIK